MRRLRPAEYHDPRDSSSEASVQRHAARYRDAVDALKRADAGDWLSAIIDVACGSGYGTNMLARKFPFTEVVGVDRNPEAIFRARADHEDLSFHCLDIGSARSWLRWFKPLQAVVCIETLEHLDGPGAQRQWIAAVSSTLKEGGLFWLACPIREEPGPSLANVFHLWEPSYDAVRSMIEWAGLEVLSHEVEEYHSTAGEVACQLAILARKP